MEAYILYGFLPTRTLTQWGNTLFLANLLFEGVVCFTRHMGPSQNSLLFFNQWRSLIPCASSRGVCRGYQRRLSFPKNELVLEKGRQVRESLHGPRVTWSIGPLRSSVRRYKEASHITFSKMSMPARSSSCKTADSPPNKTTACERSEGSGS